MKVFVMYDESGTIKGTLAVPRGKNIGIRSWHGLWTDMSNFYSAGNLSRCVTVKNVGSAATAYHLLLTTAG